MAIRLNNAGQPKQPVSPPSERPAPSTAPDYQPNRGRPEVAPGNPAEREFTSPGSQPEANPGQQGDDWRAPSDR